MNRQVTVLGGGLSGMSCALSLVRAGAQVTVLERESEVGGLARSFTEQGFCYDLGPHRLLLGSREQVDWCNALLGEELLVRERRSRIFLQGRFFHYPLRVGNAIFSMPPRTTFRILGDYARARAGSLFRRQESRSFEDWVVARFGRTLYEIFFKQYTEKAWGIPCSEISADWASQRITLLGLFDALVKSLWKRGGKPRTYASRFYYPARQGIGEIARAMAREVEAAGGRVLRSQPVSRLELAGSRLRTVRASDLSLEVDQVVSTIPLTGLVELLGDAAPLEVRRAAQALRFRAIVFVYLFLDRPRISEDHWVYLPEEKFAVNRFSEALNFSEKNAPPGRTVICAELSCEVGDRTWKTSDEVLAERAIGDLTRLGFSEVRPADILAVRTQRVPEAYPVYRIGYAERVRTVLSFGESLCNFIPIGRSALFRYNNMDHSIEMGLRAAAAALGTGDRREVAQVAAGGGYFG